MLFAMIEAPCRKSTQERENRVCNRVWKLLVDLMFAFRQPFDLDLGVFSQRLHFGT